MLPMQTAPCLNGPVCRGPWLPPAPAGWPQARPLGLGRAVVKALCAPPWSPRATGGPGTAAFPHHAWVLGHRTERGRHCPAAPCGPHCVSGGWIPSPHPMHWQSTAQLNGGGHIPGRQAAPGCPELGRLTRSLAPVCRHHHSQQQQRTASREGPKCFTCLGLT